MSDEKQRKLTVVLSEDLHRKAKIKSAKTDKPVSEVVRQALEEWVADDEDS
jgi:predicted HicB family RNase H-like nuclease